MALARVKTWNPGDVLTAADLNGEFNNVLNNPISLVSPTTGPINFNNQANTGFLPVSVTTSGLAAQAITLTSSNPAQWAYPAAAVLPGVRNLNGTITSSQTATFTADQYLLQTTAKTGCFVLNSTDLITVNLGTAGPTANGRDQAGAFASTYVHFYAISTGAYSTAIAGLVSTNPPPVGPTLPVGYSAWAYLCASPYSSASTEITKPQIVRGNTVMFSSINIALNLGNSATTATVDLSSDLPKNASNVLVNFEILTTDASANNVTQVYITSSVSFNQINCGAANGGALGVANRTLTIPNINQRLFYSINSTPPTVSVFLLGYEMPNV